MDLSQLIAKMMQLYTSNRPIQELRADIGTFAATADVMPEDEWLAGFSAIDGENGGRWPQRSYACTAIDVSDGAFVVWRDDSGVPLQLAVASSCAVPGIFPPVTINGRRYMDGGIGSTTNSEIAAGYDKVLIVALTGSTRTAATAIGDAVQRRFAAEIDVVRAAGSEVEVVVPDEAFARTIGVNLMDVTLRAPAAELGLQQGATEADRVRQFWAAQ